MISSTSSREIAGSGGSGRLHTPKGLRASATPAAAVSVSERSRHRRVRPGALESDAWMRSPLRRSSNGGASVRRAFRLPDVPLRRLDAAQGGRRARDSAGERARPILRRSLPAIRVMSAKPGAGSSREMMSKARATSGGLGGRNLLAPRDLCEEK